MDSAAITNKIRKCPQAEMGNGSERQEEIADAYSNDTKGWEV